MAVPSVPFVEVDDSTVFLHAVPAPLIMALRGHGTTVRLVIGGRAVTVTTAPGWPTSAEIVAAWVGLQAVHHTAVAQAPAGVPFVTRAALPAQIIRAEWTNATGHRVVVAALEPVIPAVPAYLQPRRLRVVAPC